MTEKTEKTEKAEKAEKAEKNERADGVGARHAGPPSTSRRSVVVVDLDGTIADASRRENQFLKGAKKDWDGFFRNMENDPPIRPVLDHVLHLGHKHDIVILTGRPDRYRAVTEQWLRRQGVTYEALLMRRSGDTRPDFVAKEALLDELGSRKIVLALDDRGPVCDAYRKRGIRCVQVASDAANQLVNETYRLMEEEAKR